jgi:cytochrome c-type biogenesis protein CcmH/NrfG
MVIAAALLVLLVVAGAAFACWPLLRPAASWGRALLAGLIVALVAGIAGGAYLALGHPYLAARTFSEPSKQDYPGLVAILAHRMVREPQDPRGWLLLARGYASLGDERDAEAAYRRGIGAMVAALSERLKTAPNDLECWQRLVRSYVVLGDPDSARTALASARKAFAGNAAAIAALDAEAKDLKLQK